MTKVDTFVFFYIHILTIIEINSKGEIHMGQFLPINRKEMEEKVLEDDKNLRG